MTREAAKVEELAKKLGLKHWNSCFKDITGRPDLDAGCECPIHFIYGFLHAKDRLIAERDAEIERLKQEILLVNSCQLYAEPVSKLIKEYEAELQAHKDVIRRWVLAREATYKCSDLILSSGTTEESQKIMQEYEDACDKLNELIGER